MMPKARFLIEVEFSNAIYEEGQNQDLLANLVEAISDTIREGYHVRQHKILKSELDEDQQKRRQVKSK